MMSPENCAYMNELGAARIPFVFILDFKGLDPLVFPIDKIPSEVHLVTPVFSNSTAQANKSTGSFYFNKNPISFREYDTAFQSVMKELRYGNSYLLNLTFPTPVETDLGMAEIYHRSEAPYKIWIEDRLVCFSPEIFVTIRNGIISSHPMKGTIDVTLPNAAQHLLDSEKERAEHATIVDLIRNDLSRVAEQVRVKRYRYLDEIQTSHGPLLQMSSEIAGQLPTDYHRHIGDILAELLPAGSVSGAPKIKTLEIIDRVETYERGHYTGVFGIFDGWDLHSAVMIRYMEQTPEGLVFKSGGGITALSNSRDEYNEMIAKVYVPIT